MKKWFLLLVTMCSALLLGVYVEATIHATRDIAAYQWIMTSFFGLFFGGELLKEIKQKKEK